MNFDYPEGATPLDADEAEGLLLTHITNRSELNRWEQENIAEAEAAVFRRKQKDVLTGPYIKRLHKKMFGNVWRWAGISDPSVRTSAFQLGRSQLNYEICAQIARSGSNTVLFRRMKSVYGSITDLQQFIHSPMVTVGMPA